jgi:hypothetical protein
VNVKPLKIGGCYVFRHNFPSGKIWSEYFVLLSFNKTKKRYRFLNEDGEILVFSEGSNMSDCSELIE